MTDRNDAIRQVEEKLGPEGSRELSAEMLNILEGEGLVTFDADAGYMLAADIDEYRWGAMLDRAIERLV